jgi:hypothetical protein
VAADESAVWDDAASAPSASVLAFRRNSMWEQLESFAKIAPLITAIIALCAACIALSAIYAQRDIARRRAAIDFFLKTETDAGLFKLYNRFREIDVDRLLDLSPDQWRHDEHYKNARQFLNICELIACGVQYKAFSKRISRRYCGDILVDSYKEKKELINKIRETQGEGNANTYLDLQIVCDKWKSDDRAPWWRK